VQAGTGAIAAKNESARPFLEHESEIFGAHDWRHVDIDLVLAGDLARDIGGERSLPRVIDDDRIAIRVGDLGRSAIGEIVALAAYLAAQPTGTKQR
jgi:hypothetical protein